MRNDSVPKPSRSGRSILEIYAGIDLAAAAALRVAHAIWQKKPPPLHGSGGGKSVRPERAV